MRISVAFGVAIAAAAVGGPAQATLSISSAATQNVACSHGRCKATAVQAVLNVKDLQRLLRTNSQVSVNAGVAHDMAFDAPLTWSNANALSLTARGPILVNKTITVAGHAAVNIQSKDMVFAPKASLKFWDLTNPLTINGNLYMLFGDYYWLAMYGAQYSALAGDIDNHYEYYLQLFPRYSDYVLDGLGHTISNIDVSNSGAAGLIGTNTGTIRNLALKNVVVNVSTPSGFVTGTNNGVIDHVSVSGTMDTQYWVGGIAGFNGTQGVITNSRARVKIKAIGYGIGGLVGQNNGFIANSFAEGEIKSRFGYCCGVGGLVGLNAKGGKIRNGYSLVRLSKMSDDVRYGGLIGWSMQNSSVENSYAAGKTEPARRSGGLPGGVVGYVEDYPTFLNTYWDLDKGVHNPHQGAGSNRDQQGLTGLSDAQLKSALPTGFDPTIWAQSASINNGYPYLLANPPQ